MIRVIYILCLKLSSLFTSQTSDSEWFHRPGKLIIFHTFVVIHTPSDWIPHYTFSGITHPAIFHWPWHRSLASVQRTVCFSLNPPICSLTVHPSNCLSIYPSTCTCSIVCQITAASRSVHPSRCLHLSIHPPMCLLLNQVFSKSVFQSNLPLPFFYNLSHLVCLPKLTMAY